MTWDLTTPADSEQIRQGASRIRELKQDVQTALQSAGTFPGANPASPVFEPFDPPVGCVLDYAGATSPNANWHICDGSAISRTTYAALFAAIGTAFGIGDGTTTFNIPDARGRAIIAAGAGSGLTARTLAATGGEETHTLSVPEIPAGLTVSDPTHGHDLLGTSVTGVKNAVPLADINARAVAASQTNPDPTSYFTNNDAGTPLVKASATGITVGGGGGAHNNMQPFLALNKIIKIQ